MNRRSAIVSMATAAIGALIAKRRLKTRTIVAAIYDGIPNLAGNITKSDDLLPFPATVPVISARKDQRLGDDADASMGVQIGTARLELRGNRVVAHLTLEREPLCDPAYPCLWGSAEFHEAGDHRQRKNMQIDTLVFECVGNVDPRIGPLEA